MKIPLDTKLGQSFRGALLLILLAASPGCSLDASQAERNEPATATSTDSSRPELAEIETREQARESQRDTRESRGDTVEKLSIQVLASYPHDPTAFTQGLLWHDGALYESTGLYGRSSLRKSDPESGQVLLRKDLERHFFGEGLVWVDGRLIQLTWKAGIARVYDPQTFDLLDEWGFNGEGWGLTYDGESLIMSDGSPRLTFRSTEDFRWLKTVEISLDGKPLAMINELEYAEGMLYANVWGEDRIVRLDPETGVVNGIIQARGLLTPQESRMVDVLNGIAYDPESKTFWLTGKFWPRMFQVKFVPDG